MSKPQMVTLKDGTVAAEALVNTTITLLRRYFEDTPGVFLELVDKVRDPRIKLSDETLLKLQKSYMAKWDGSIPEASAEIIRNAVEGEGLRMRIVSPIAL